MSSASSKRGLLVILFATLISTNFATKTMILKQLGLSGKALLIFDESYNKPNKTIPCGAPNAIRIDRAFFTERKMQLSSKFQSCNDDTFEYLISENWQDKTQVVQGNCGNSSNRCSISSSVFT